ncbi:LacI family DNA-binding transcriptional regulator [Agreia sp. COWG]|uniref:LacI family DNA-binding transcriptional regulator n=1 Tax=Agreia sp. COWG TaxID=2773266 RepID=UPI00192800FA|nr:LacI family DNA-binding transcriptional regulator [Agreia sp. COWG]CAD5991021.1 Transcriptional regulator, LacI family [Agreia sp. COWG]
MKSATIYDVAKRAGVSHQTVSRYLSGFEGIRPNTREKVERALAELEYRPNSAARFLRLRRTNRIGYLADRMDQSGPSRTLVGAAAAARELGYVLDIVSVDGGDEVSVREALDVIMQDQIAGIVLSAQTRAGRAAVENRELSIPVARDFDLRGTDGGEPLNSAAGRVAAEHLVALGHRRAAYLAGPPVWTASGERRQGFSDAFIAAGGAVVMHDEGDWSARSGYEAGARLARRAGEFTAIAVANDSMAMGTLAALSAAGIRVPGEMSIIGTDDAPEAEYMVPSLSSVAMDFAFEGRYVVSTLVAEIEGKQPHGGLVLPTPRLVQRRSSAPIGD